MRILAIETSCDETALAFVEAGGGLRAPKFKILQEAIASQIETHRPWGGVVPSLARREHEKNLPLLFENLKLKIKNLDRLAVTIGPGLEPCLWSGINFAKEIHKKNFPKAKLVGANHLEGHLYSFLLAEKTGISNFKFQISKLFPAVHLLVSGGHTILILMESMKKWRKLGETRDDAVGEAFDKVARMLKLSYPGGPEISRLAEKGNPEAIDFPRPMINSKDYNFSFSGLKTAVLYHLRGNKKTRKADVAASFEKAAVDVLVAKTIRAAREFDTKSIMLSGGVAANKKLRTELRKKTNLLTTRYNLRPEFIVAPQKYNTDNAAMIAVAAYLNSLTKKKYPLRAKSNLNI